MRKLWLCFWLTSFSYFTNAQQWHTVSIATETDTLEILYGDTVIYMLQDQQISYGAAAKDLSYCLVARLNGRLLKKNSQLQWKGEPTTLQFVSANDAIAEFKKASFFNSPGFFRVKTEGTVELIIIAGPDTLKLPICVQAVNIESHFARELVADFLGKPTRTFKDFVPYGKMKQKDGLTYDARKATRGLQIDHWYYEMYPELIIQFSPPAGSFNVATKQAGWEQLVELIQQTY